MPVPRPIEMIMNSVKSAELIRELKADTEKLVETNSLVVKPESEIHSMVNLDSSYTYDTKANHLVTLRRNVIPYPDHNYGQQPPLTPPEQASPDPNEQTDTGNEDEDEEGVTRCICGFDHDDGYMICCDRCGSWQHIDCMGIKSDSVPETYHCVRCEPRQLDVERARAIQQRKKDTLTDDDGDEDTDTEEEPGQTYTAVSNTPTRITLTATTVLKKKGKNRLKSTSSEGKTKKRKKVNRKRQRTSTSQLSETPLQIDSNSLESHSGFDNFQEIEENVYDPAVKCLALQDTENSFETMPREPKKLFVLTDVLENRKGLIAVEDIQARQYITEYKGKVLLKATYEEANPFFKRSCPFLLHYNKIDQLELVVDARTVGNEARYLRRSCSPNADVTHFVKDGNFHMLIHSKQDIVMGTEITIPFDYPLMTYVGYVECVCREPTCPALKHSQQFLQHSGRKRPKYSVPDASSSTRNSASENQGETDSDDNELDVGRPMSRRKKLSREERKLQAYLKQIEKMEKKEKKVKDPKTPQRPGLIPDQLQTPSSLFAKSSQSFEKSNSLQSQPGPISRRISTCTPGSGKKRISVNRKVVQETSTNDASFTPTSSYSPWGLQIPSLKMPVGRRKKRRPRISSCSSDPLSPEIITCSITSSSTTPLQEHSPHIHIIDQNGHIKQKTKKERIQENLSLSVNVDKTPPSFRDVVRKPRRDYLDTVTGSPTPPSTPGQLSPTATHLQTNLSVDTSSNLASPTGSYLSMQEKRNVLNGLLQIADQNDNHSTCSGSPQHTVITSNGMVTSEEVMGEMVARDDAPQTPAGKASTRRFSNDRKYFGSLKKRWLIQYNQHTAFNIQPRNGISTGLSPILTSSLMNDFSIQKRAEQIASCVFKTPKSFIPLKKRRLRETMMYTPTDCKETTGNKIVEDSSLDHIKKPVLVNENSVVSNNKVMNIECSEVESSKEIHADGRDRVDNGDCTDVPITLSLRRDLAADSSNRKSEISEKARTIIESDITLMGSSEENLQISSEIGNTNSKIALTGQLSLQGGHKTTSSDLLYNNSVISQGEDKVDLKSSEVNSDTMSSVPSGKDMKEMPDSANVLYFSVSTLDGLRNDKIVYSNANFSHSDCDHNVPLSRDFSSLSNVREEAIRTSVTTSDASVVSTTSVQYPDNIAPTLENSVMKNELPPTDYSGIMNDSLVRASSILRDPRLSSSSSRSSRDSIDGNILIRSDSVSSLEDASIQRMSLDKKPVNDKMDGTRNAKKKMSLREYRNRKKSMPAVTLIQNNIPMKELTSKSVLQSQPVFFTDTDSLLTPRTLSLSASFVSLSGKEMTSTVSSVGSVSMMTLSSHQSLHETQSNGPLFEPVSPSEDISLENTVGDEATNFEAMDMGEDSQSTQKFVIDPSDADLLPSKDPRKQYTYGSAKHVNRKAAKLIYQSQEMQPVMQQGKSITSHSPTCRQTQAFDQHFHG